MPLPLAGLQLGRQVQHRTAQAELAAGLGQQPPQLYRRLVAQFGGLGAAAIGEQIQFRSAGPAAEHQGAQPRRAIGRHAGKLQPAGLG